jgi:hypothetical protein
MGEACSAVVEAITRHMEQNRAGQSAPSRAEGGDDGLSLKRSSRSPTFRWTTCLVRLTSILALPALF